MREREKLLMVSCRPAVVCVVRVGLSLRGVHIGVVGLFFPLPGLASECARAIWCVVTARLMDAAWI